jgi:PKD repeat protein
MKIIQESLLAGVDPSSGVQGEAESGEREALSFWRGCLLGACVLLVTIGSGVGRVSASEPAAGGQVAGNANRMPAAAFRYTLSGLAIAVDAAESEDPDGSIVAYDWRFGDGTTGEGVTASHTYSRPGTYTVSLTVTDDAGAMVGADYVVAPRAVNQPPSAHFSHWVKGLEIGVDASDSTDPEGLVVEFDWDFGDGTTARGVRASHTYATGGSYAVRLTVADDPGATGTATKVVSLSEPASTSQP